MKNQNELTSKPKKPHQKPSLKKVLMICGLSIIGFFVMMFSIALIKIYIIDEITGKIDKFHFVYSTEYQGYYIAGTHNNIEYTHLEIPATHKNKPVIGISGIGDDCPNLESIKLPNSLDYIGGGCFSGCTKLSSITLPNSLKTIGNSAFAGCKNLSSITLPNGLEEIGDNAFSSCTSLTELNIPNSVNRIGMTIIKFCDNLSSLTVSSNNSNYVGRGNCIIADNKVVLGCKSSVIPNDGSVTEIGEKAFWGCTGLSELQIPSSIKKLGYEAFAYCSSLTYIEIPEQITRIESQYVFSNCINLKTVYLSDKFSYLRNGNIFSGCTKLDNFIVELGNENFYSASGCLLTKDGALVVGNNSGTIPQDGSIKMIGPYAFSNRTGITELVLPAGIVDILDDAFAECTNLKSLVIPSTIEYIGSGIFHKCDALQYVFIGTEKIPRACYDDTIREDKIIYYKDEWEFINGKPTLK